jgi:hypothetical protein
MGGLRPRWHNSEEIFETNAVDPYWRITIVPNIGLAANWMPSVAPCALLG